MARKAIILFAHGSRDPLWRKPMEAVAARLRERDPHTAVLCAYLELDTPSLPEAAQVLADGGADALTVVPMFLGTGRHARTDLPVLVDAVRARHPHVSVHVQPSVGEDDRVIELLAKIALE